MRYITIWSLMGRSRGSELKTLRKVWLLDASRDKSGKFPRGSASAGARPFVVRPQNGTPSMTSMVSAICSVTARIW
jgi:hypothetical protein